MKYIVKTNDPDPNVENTYVSDIHLKGATLNGTYWASYTSDKNKMWITNDPKKAVGVAVLINGIVETFKEVTE